MSPRIYKLFTGHYPFHESRLDAQVINKVLTGKRPPRLDSSRLLGLSDEVWQIMERCWKEDRRKRPRISSALQDLKRAFYFSDHSISIPKHLTFDAVVEKGKPKVELGMIDQDLKITLKPVPIASKSPRYLYAMHDSILISSVQIYALKKTPF